ncbi:RAMP superfamily CRISPR-associated protein [uncultured Thiodictyon sp.]|jgi:hypothetical protein|uniref:RAMP superfamily CRISPR-associated protein n=1 Tax=uncultured Thiodictyon sp. TaxID=1846217 RepID=UPI0025D545E7|nr:RAMP superfamily CRISPR-associated protein [uncultured Thiodictyon sp.]
MSRSPQFGGGRRGRQDERPAKTDAAPVRADAPTVASQPQPAAGSPAEPPATRFHLPYQFVPVSGKVQGGPVQLTPWTQVETGVDEQGQPSPTRHDRWLPGTHCGRILCRLELVTPTFVGARQTDPETKGGAKTAQPYERRGDRAIPANSLRGMIGSVAEAISQSALRVLEERHYSVRKPASQALPSKGTIDRDHDRWLVRPEDAPGSNGILIPEPVLQTFSRLWVERVLAERTLHGEAKASKFPKAFAQYRPGQPHFERPETWRPEPGMPVFFTTRQEGDGQPEVSEISFSAIWRKEVSGSSFDFFRAIGANLVPWGHDGRSALTPVEALFGVVEDRPERTRARGQNLASRLRFFDALPTYRPGQQQVSVLDAKPLRILASPKPPCPPLYFDPAGKPGVHIRKIRLGEAPDQDQPKGRKRYLPHPKKQVAAQWWQSREDGHAEQKLCCAPMAAGQAFWFHIDFDNLTDAELTLLRVALEPDQQSGQPASAAFQHRLGLGKPLGLGSVRLRLEAILIIERAARYSRAALTQTARYHRVHVPDPTALPTWPARYRDDLPAPGEHGYPPLSELPWKPDLVDDHSRAILAHLGDPASLEPAAWVHHPLIAAQLPSRDGRHGAESELKTYAWHVQNEKAKAPAALQPVNPKTPYLPTLPVWMPMEVTGLPSDQSFSKLRDELERLFGAHGHGPAQVSVSKPRGRPVTATVLMSAADGQQAMTALNQHEFFGGRLVITLARP